MSGFIELALDFCEANYIFDSFKATKVRLKLTGVLPVGQDSRGVLYDTPTNAGALSARSATNHN